MNNTYYTLKNVICIVKSQLKTSGFVKYVYYSYFNENYSEEEKNKLLNKLKTTNGVEISIINV